MQFVAKPAGQLFYNYDLAGNLTTISGPGVVAYTYDPVGNRTQQASTVPALSSGSFGYDADDRLAGDVYDPNGNTVNSGGVSNVYDFENHLVQQGGATMVYDARFASRSNLRDGNGERVAKTVAGVTTKFLVSDVNPTGYAQVVSETFSGGTGARETSHAYVYGLDRISQVRSYFTGSQSLTQTSYYVYDGHGSVRALTDPSGNVTDTYDYDAFGNQIHTAFTTTGPGAVSAPTFNEFLFAAEQFDADLHLYYNRARYLNVTTGRFWSMDAYEGRADEPDSLHKYLYVSDSPVDRVDSSGNQEINLGATSFAIGIAITIATAGIIGFNYVVDQADANVGGVAAQEAAEPMAAAAITTLQDGSHIDLFQRYFGPPTASQLELVTNNYEQIVINGLSQQISFYHDYTAPSGEYAKSIPHGPLRIGLGPAFFSAQTVGRDSKAGTIIHELSHIVLGTRDYAYGFQAATSLPAYLAVNNADTYEYYAEDSYTILYGGGSR